MSVTFTQVKNTIDLSEKIKIGSGEKVVKTDKIGRSKKIEFTITSKAGKFFAYFDGEKYAGSYKKQADVEKIAKDYLKLVGEELQENRAKRDAMKAMGMRRGKDSADVDNDATADDMKAADKNIMVQLRKVITLRGMKPVTFDNGKKAKINPKDAEKMLSIYQGLKPASKLQLQKVLSKSPQDFAKAVKQLKENEFFDEDITEAKSATGYEIFHKDYSSAMQHATDFAKKKGQEIDPSEIDNKVATGPKKPSKGKENSFMLKTKKGKSWSVQVYNMGNKYELNMYLTSENDPLKEAVKYRFVAVDTKGKIIGFSSKQSDAKDMAKRNKGVFHKLKEPMSPKVGDKEVNRPFNPVLKAQVEIDEGMKMDDPKLIKIFDKLKKGSKIKIKHDSTLERGKDFISYTVTAKNIVGKGKRFEQEKITLKNDDNPTGMKKYLYNRDGKVTMAAGDMAVSIADIREEIAIDESMMSRIHQMVSDGASAKEIADEISKARPKNKVDVKTIEKLIKGMKGDMSESVEKNITFKSFIKQL